MKNNHTSFPELQTVTIELFGLPKKKGKRMPLDQPITFGSQSILPGKGSTSWVDVPLDADNMELFADWTQHLNETVFLTIAIEYRTGEDDKTIREIGSSSRFGGPVRGDHGEPAAGLATNQSIPEPKRADRQVRMLVRVKDGSFQSAGGYFKFTKAGS